MLRAGREEQSVPLSLPRRSPRRVQQPARGWRRSQWPLRRGGPSCGWAAGAGGGARLPAARLPACWCCASVADRRSDGGARVARRRRARRRPCQQRRPLAGRGVLFGLAAPFPAAAAAQEAGGAAVRDLTRGPHSASALMYCSRRRAAPQAPAAAQSAGAASAAPPRDAPAPPSRAVRRRRAARYNGGPMRPLSELMIEGCGSPAPRAPRTHARSAARRCGRRRRMGGNRQRNLGVLGPSMTGWYAPPPRSGGPRGRACGRRSFHPALQFPAPLRPL